MHNQNVQFFVRLAEALRDEDITNKNLSEQYYAMNKQYVNDEQNVLQREHIIGQHPHKSDIRRLDAIMKRLQYECVNYKFTVYRTAIKIATLQRTLMSESQGSVG